MSNLSKFIGPAMLLACAFCVSEVSANSIAYSPDTNTGKGLVNLQPKSEKSEKPDKPFAAAVHLSEAIQVKSVHGTQRKKHGQSEDEHPTNGNSHAVHDDQGDDSEDTTSHPHLPGPGDEIDWEAEDSNTSPIPPILPTNIPVTTIPSAVPLPAALWLFLSGIIGLGVTGVTRRR